MRTSIFAVSLVVIGGAAIAQEGNPFSSDTKATYDMMKRVVVRSAEKVSEEHYSFKPSADVRSYGQLLAHIADANYMICSRAKGETRQPAGIEKSMTSRADIIKALNESFAYCDPIYSQMTDAKGMEKVKFFGGERTRLAVLNFNTAHDYEHYGNLVTYMRIKGIVPPSSEPRK